MGEDIFSLRRTIWQQLADLIGNSVGWRVDVNPALPKKCVVIGAPHTSNMDLFLGFLMMAVARIKLYWVGKDTLFRFPLGIIFRALGGLPVNRRKRTNFTAQMVCFFEQSDTLRLAITPMGTRKKTTHWKTGFYHIAVAAGVPIAFCYVDYGRKVIGIGPSIVPTGDIEADFEIIRHFYADVRGRYPENQSDIRVKPRT